MVFFDNSKVSQSIWFLLFDKILLTVGIFFSEHVILLYLGNNPIGIHNGVDGLINDEVRPIKWSDTTGSYLLLLQAKLLYNWHVYPSRAYFLSHIM